MRPRGPCCTDWADVIWAIITRMDPSREWGRTITMPDEVQQRVAGLFDELMGGASR